MIVAKHYDGSPVTIGDRVMVVWDNGTKLFGDVAEIGPPMKFAGRQFVELQTYRIRVKDGIRPAHAWHIKHVVNDNKEQK